MKLVITDTTKYNKLLNKNNEIEKVISRNRKK